MNYKTNLMIYIQNLYNKFYKKIIFFDSYLYKGIFFLFIGFLIGNLFGTFLNNFRIFIIYDGFIILIIVLIQEIISYLAYHSKKRKKLVNFDFTIVSHHM